MSAETLHNLEISAIVLSSLSGLFGEAIVLLFCPSTEPLF